MKKYGLQLRVKPQEKKQPNPPVSNPIFADDDDDDNVEKEILRQAHKSKIHRDVEEQLKKALEEDPSVFDYDGVYDKMKEKQIRPILQERQERKPKYIQALIDKAKLRQREGEIIYERKLAKERTKDEHLYADKDRFVTGAYKKKLAEQAKWLEEERLRELREEKDDVTKKTDLTDFYFNLSKNVAFGAEDADTRRPEKGDEECAASSSELPREPQRHQVTETENQTEEGLQVKATDEPSAGHAPESSDVIQSTEVPATAVKEHHRKSGDDVAAARERFLARKKAKIQQG